MKKFVSMIMALAMVCALSVTAFAVDFNDKDVTGGNATASTNVTATISGDGQGATTNVYSVVLTWTTVGTLAYNKGNYTYVWNPSTHKYDEATGSVKASWTTPEASVVITVTNHSDKPVTASAEYKTIANGTVTSTMAWDETNPNGSIELEDATNNGAAAPGNDTAGAEVTKTIKGTISVNGVPEKADIGTITVTIAKKS